MFEPSEHLRSGWSARLIGLSSSGRCGELGSIVALSLGPCASLTAVLGEALIASVIWNIALKYLEDKVQHTPERTLGTYLSAFRRVLVDG